MWVMWDMSYLNFCTCKRVMWSNMTYMHPENGTHVNESCRIYEWVMSHIWMSHVTHLKESHHTYEWVASHTRMSHVTHMNESCHTYEWVMSHIRMSHITHIKDSCVMYVLVMSHIWMSHVLHMDESCHTLCECVHVCVCACMCALIGAGLSVLPYYTWMSCVMHTKESCLGWVIYFVLHFFMAVWCAFRKRLDHAEEGVNMCVRMYIYIEVFDFSCVCGCVWVHIWYVHFHSRVTYVSAFM